MPNTGMCVPHGKLQIAITAIHGVALACLAHRVSYSAMGCMPHGKLKIAITAIQGIALACLVHRVSYSAHGVYATCHDEKLKIAITVIHGIAFIGMSCAQGKLKRHGVYVGCNNNNNSPICPPNKMITQHMSQTYACVLNHGELIMTVL